MVIKLRDWLLIGECEFGPRGRINSDLFDIIHRQTKSVLTPFFRCNLCRSKIHPMVYDNSPFNMSFGHASPLLGMGCDSGSMANLPRRRHAGYASSTSGGDYNYQNENICIPPPPLQDRNQNIAPSYHYTFSETTSPMMSAHLHRNSLRHDRDSIPNCNHNNNSIVVSSSTNPTEHHHGSSAPLADHLQPSELVGLTREERRRRRRATIKYRTAHATRERIRVEAFNVAFSELRKLLPTLPPDKKLSKIEILKLGICYIAYLNHVLET